MRWRLFLLTTAMAGQTAPDLLTQVREKMGLNLMQVPNYTCTETIERSERRSPRQKYQPLDKVRLEVALVGGRELLSWPGAGKFEEREVGDFVGGGTTASGDYALHAQTIFRTNKPTFRRAPDEAIDGRTAMRFDYDVTVARSEFMVRTGDRAAKVPYHGSFWADPGNLDLMRLDVVADKVPAELDVAKASTQILYRTVKVGQSDFLLPRLALGRTHERRKKQNGNALTAFALAQSRRKLAAIHPGHVDVRNDQVRSDFREARQHLPRLRECDDFKLADGAGTYSGADCNREGANDFAIFQNGQLAVWDANQHIPAYPSVLRDAVGGLALGRCRSSQGNHHSQC